jgi:hypothetical protein
MVGAPPNCRPECTINSDCPSDKACVNTRCIDPCPGVCGSNAECYVYNHNPVCQCSRDFVGDPFVACKSIAIGLAFETRVNVRDMPKTLFNGFYIF